MFFSLLGLAAMVGGLRKHVAGAVDALKVKGIPDMKVGVCMVSKEEDDQCWNVK